MNSSYKDLLVWRRAMELVLEIYRCTKTFPREEAYGLVAQMRRAAVSIPSNIAEGKRRYTHKELTYSYSMHGVRSWNWKRTR